MGLRELIKDEHLRTRLENIWNKIEKEFETRIKGEVTLQGFQHFKNVENNLEKLIKDKKFSDLEIFLLSVSACLHDICKGVCKEGEDHGAKAADHILDEREFYGLNKQEAAAIASICAAHSVKSLNTKNTRIGKVKEKIAIGSEVVNLWKLSAVFILADTLDTTIERFFGAFIEVAWQG